MSQGEPKYHPARLCLCVVLPLGLAMAFITPPFQPPDEQVHLFRAFQVSEGQVVAMRNGNATGGFLPVSLVQIAHLFAWQWRGEVEKKLDFCQWHSAFAIPLAPEQRTMISFPSSAFYPPLLYLPQALGIWAGRLAGVGALGILYAARVGNVLAYCLVFWFAIRLMPVHKWVMALVALLPISVFLAASASADGVAISYGALFTATAFAAALGEGRGKHFCWWLVLLSFGMGLGKPYLPLLLLAFLLPAERAGGRPRYALWLLAVFGACAAALIFWQANVRNLLVPTETGLSTFAARFQDLLNDPCACLAAIWNTWMAPGFAASMLYSLAGWPLPPAYVMVYPAGLVLTAIMDRGPESVDFQIGQRLLAGTVLLLGIFYVSAWLYVSYTPADCPLVRGIQGRYFFPLLVPALSILWMSKGRDRSRPLALGYAIMGVSTFFVAAQALFHRFY